MIRTLMLSGDAPLVAEAIGREAGIDEARGGAAARGTRPRRWNSWSAEGYARWA